MFDLFSLMVAVVALIVARGGAHPNTSRLALTGLGRP